MAILKANPGILKHGSEMKMWMRLCIKRGSYFGFGKRQNKEDRKKYCKAKNDAKRVKYMAMDHKSLEVTEKVNLCHDSCELLRIAKQRAGQRIDVVGVSFLEDENRAVNVSVDD